MKQEHDRKVAEVAAHVGAYYAQKKPFRVFHGSTNSTRIMAFRRDELVDVSSLDQVVSIDIDKQTAIVEPNVPMDKLVKETLRCGLLPPVITEFPGITVGGGIQGGAGESSSFKWGFLSQATNWHEYVLADGNVVTCSPKRNADLFYGAAGSCGSLGVITAAELQLVPAKKYVALTYIPVDSFEAAVQSLQEHTSKEKGYDFIDGIMFGADHGLVVCGKLTDTKTGKLRRFSRAHDQWYYLHTERIDQQKQEITETVPLLDYLFRYDRGAFWVGRFAFERFDVPFNRLSRSVLDPILHTRKLYQALQDSGASQEHIVQDLTLPLDKAVSFLQFVDKELDIYPLWLCPIKPEPRSPLLCNGIDTPLAINIGVWGPRLATNEAFMRQNKLIEKKLQKLGGKKWMYAHCYYTEKEFWQVYDKAWYERLRQKYKASSLPDIYEKTVVRKRYKVNARRGALKTLFGQAKLRIEK